jgi:hypothetical protein
MSPRVLLAVFALQAPAALAQSDDYTPPPMVPVDEPADAPAQAAQPPPAEPQQFQYAQPGTYSNAPVDPNAPAQPQPQQPAPAAKPGTKTTFAGSFMESTRKKHFLALASGSIGVTRLSPGLTVDVRAEADIGKFALLAGYTGFGSGDVNTNGFLGHFMGLGGWAIFSREEITWRLLAGVDVINTPEAAAVGFAVGTNVRAMLNDHFGLDSAIFVTPLPYRQFEFRAALVLRWWSIFEAQVGWRFQALEASQAGNVVTLFSTAPSINGPMAALGLTF